MLNKIPFILNFLFVYQIGIAQIIQISPAFPTVNDVVTIHYDASQGNGGLVGVSPVYTHTELLLRVDFQVVGLMFRKLGASDTNVLMTDLGNNIHELSLT